MEEKLRKIGLSKNESTIYLFLLRSGSTTTGRIIKETRIANSRVYETLNALTDKGLVSYTVQKNGKHFKAEDPSSLLEHEKERLDKIKVLLPQLESIQNQSEELTSTAVYEGFKGFKTAFAKIIIDCPEDKEIKIIGFSEQAYANKSLRDFIVNMNLKSVQKRQKLKILMDKKSKSSLGKDRAREKYSEVKYMPEGYISPAAIDIFEDYVYIFLWEKKPFVFAIKNQLIANSFSTYFKFLWSMAKAE
ncbi:hypothetical protein H6501_00180 [Candidatus Woesearchaeota archaeon]|nr:hypothetical protein [Nanoarchaeota archaeon]MCB9369999.1 hypothetical protein [Candidatus Woesearchaeota archaeon]USN44534.1 MAG: hypothetical protein H6500_01650 [Candidatus Woesearchaeota archaeon]